MTKPSVLVTGASSGIGAATASLLLDRGWRVFAAARRLELMAPLATQGAELLTLDLSNAESRSGLAAQIANRVGALDEVNVFGLIGLTQLLLPAMRERGRGRVINVSSIAGHWVTPGSGWYGASKFALEALSDALRLELKSFGLQVVVVEPGLIATNFGAVAFPSMQKALECNIYGQMMRNVRAGWEKVYQGASSPIVVAQTIENALTKPKPAARYRCGHQSISVLASELLPTRVWDRFISAQMLQNAD